MSEETKRALDFAESEQSAKRQKTDVLDELVIVSRDEHAQKEEDKGLVTFNLIWNGPGCVTDYLVHLMNVKKIFSLQLPKMPREYICRLVLDRNHRSLCILKVNQVIGGICFRPFYSQRFAEIVFCAILSSEQGKGYGTRVMNHLKEHVKTEGVEYFLTYADNYAIGYFKKQGFTKQITMPKERWEGFIKDYDGGTLMECRISDKVDYSDIPGMIKKQRAQVHKKISTISNAFRTYPGLTIFSSASSIPVMEIPGVKETGYQPLPQSSYPHRKGSQANSPLGELTAKLNQVLKNLKKFPDSWPFRAAVDGGIVKDYYEIVGKPMDLATMEAKLKGWEYKTVEQFASDFALIINNCRIYNGTDTTYFTCAERTETLFYKLMNRYQLTFK